MGNVKLELSIKGLMTERPASTASGLDGWQKHLNVAILRTIQDEGYANERIDMAKTILDGVGTIENLRSANELIVFGVNSTATANAVVDPTDITADLTGHISSPTAATSVYFEVWDGSLNVPASMEDVTTYEATESPLDLAETGGGADVSYTLTGLTAATDYSFRVLVTNEYSSIRSGSVQFTTAAGA